MVWEFAQSGPGLLISGTIIIFIFNKIFAANPKWAKYEGWLITAVKFAEKAIDDDVEGKGLARANAALKYFIKSYTEAKGKAPSKKLIEEAKQGLSIVHHKLETSFTLKKPAA